MIALLVLGMAAQQAGSATQTIPVIEETPNALVRRAVEQGLAGDAKAGKFMFRLVRIKPERTETKELIETRDGLVSRLLAVNGKPLTQDQRRREEEKLDRLLTDPKVQRERRKEQQEDQERVLKLVRALPDAFIY